MEPSVLLAFLKSQGHRVIDVAIGDGRDPRTWKLYFAPGTTADEMSAALTSLSQFDPDSTAVRDAVVAGAAREASNSQMIKAFFRFFIYTTQGPDVVIDQKMIDEANALLERCFKEAAQG